MKLLLKLKILLSVLFILNNGCFSSTDFDEWIEYDLKSGGGESSFSKMREDYFKSCLSPSTELFEITQHYIGTQYYGHATNFYGHDIEVDPISNFSPSNSFECVSSLRDIERDIKVSYLTAPKVNGEEEFENVVGNLG